MIEDIFLNEGVLESLGGLSEPEIIQCVVFETYYRGTRLVRGARMANHKHKTQSARRSHANLS